MTNITIRLTVFTVVLTVALSMMAAPAVAAPGDKVTVTDPDQMDEYEKKGVMPGDNVQFPESFFDEKIGPGNSVANDAAPEDRFLKAKKAFDGDKNANYPDSVFDGDKNANYPDSVFDGDDDWQDGSDPVLSP
ncbi:hypothetical protein [Halorientalis pallida]|uniref:Uncharacterized protein n=1 Tax=Halorientalis pallida TaxID=2479928 RepID=A0A498L2L5_9EURY|nr:hypothetical protein [Halorientalis pallida]RXK48011.1 hypothetical protein EAF64_15390 [Halorientalis pallida]